MSIARIQAALPKDSSVDWQNIEARERVIQSRIDQAVEAERARFLEEKTRLLEELRGAMAE